MSNKRILIHIGFPRCGSTLLQTWLFPKFGDGVKVVTPASSDRRLVDFLIEHFIMPGRNASLSPVTESERQEVEGIIAEYSEPVLLISCEGLVGDSYDNMLPLPHLVESLQSLFANCEIILVIRRQADLARSYYRYAAEEGYYGSYARFVGYSRSGFEGFRLQRYAGVNIDPRMLDFDKFVAYLEASFGAGRVHVLPYEWIQRDLARFCQRLSEISGSELRAPANPPAVVNRGADGAELVLLKFFNRLWDIRLLGIALVPRQPWLAYLEQKSRSRGGLGLRILRALSSRLSPLGLFRTVSPIVSPALGPILSTLGITGLRSDAAISRAIMDAVSASNAALDRRLGGVLAGLGYCDAR